MSWLTGKALALLLVGSLAFNVGMGTTFGVRAYNRHCGQPCPHGCRGPHRMFHGRLDLRPDQLAHIELEGDRLQTELQDLHQLLAQESAVLSDLMVAPEPDREAIAAQLDKLAALHAQKQEYVVDHFLRFRESLDENQREIFAQTIRDVFARWGARYPGWDGPPGADRRHGHGRPHGPHGRQGWQRGMPPTDDGG